MGYEPYPNQNREELWGSSDSQDHGYRPDRDRYRSSAREYAATGEFDRDRGAHRDREQYGTRADRDESRYGNRDEGYGRNTPTRGYAGDQSRSDTSRTDYGRRPEGYAYQDRNFLNRAGDEVRSWFGDEEAERRREYDARYDERNGNADRDHHYRGWRNRQIADLDRDYDEYRSEHATRFENEFGSWRTERQTQRTSLSRVSEHQEVIGSDGQHVGTVDKVRGDRIILTKTDDNAGGHHHSIPSRWIESVDEKITIRKTAEEAKAAWRDEDRSGGDKNEQGGKSYLSRSFSGMY